MIKTGKELAEYLKQKQVFEYDNISEVVNIKISLVLFSLKSNLSNTHTHYFCFQSNEAEKIVKSLWIISINDTPC